MSNASGSVENVRTFLHSAATSSVDSVRAFVNSQFYDEEKWALNMKLLRAAGLFTGSILLMRNYGDLMAI